MSSLSGFKPGIYTSTTRPSTPFIGQTIFETDTGKILCYYGTTIGWQPMWSESWGEIGYVEKLTTFTMTDAVNPEDVPTMSLSWTSLVGRFYVADIGFQLRHPSAIASVGAALWDETGTQILGVTQGSTTPGASQDTQTPKVMNSMAIAGNGLVKTIKLRTTKGAGAGEVVGSATQKILMSIRDVGPSAPPVITL